ncbi:ATP-binding protein [Haliangium sp.]|uniref:sensor histidine kinase n=1 Tax=Haliangium sp. TaxID=2663208 RepID=UPI003D0A21AE
MNTTACNSTASVSTDATTASLPTIKRHITTILLIEDDDVAAAKLELQLAQPGSDLFVVHRITRLSEMCHHRARDIDVIFLDTSLPDASGVAAIEQARARMPNTPIAVLADTCDKTLVLGQAARLGCGYVIRTRADRRELVLAIRHAKARVRYQELDHCLARTDRMVAVGGVAAGVAAGLERPAQALLEGCARLQAHLGELTSFFDKLRRHLSEGSTTTRCARIEAQLSADGERLVSDLARIGREDLRNVERILSLLDATRTMAQPGRAPLEQVQLNDIVEEACAIVRHDLADRAYLVFDLGRLPSLMADRAGLVHAVVNLLRNAGEAFRDQPGQGKHHGDSKRITVTTRYLPGRFVLSIEDTGCGIPTEMQRQVFEPFVTTKPEGQGLGLGLPLCAEYVRRHGGEVRLASAPGTGTRVEIHLPEDGTSASAPSPRRGRAKTTPNILIVDERRELRRNLGGALHTLGNVVYLRSIDEMLMRLQHNVHYDLVVCDLATPQHDAALVYRSLLRQAPAVAARVVFCIDDSMSTYRSQWLEALRAPVVHKPLTVTALRHLLHHMRRAASPPPANECH